ncbi:LysR substrate-binding domain-containing protein [Brucella cytisi]|uniref:LysR family transcriptional regulator n=1 Tax=Brucella cytisi TaxID=407152 RepID=UPI0035DEBE66
MDRIAALQFFVRVVESGSFSQAARELGVGQPAVSKQVATLERRLGAPLLHRTSRGLRATPAGADLYESAIRILGDLDDAESRVANGHERPTGSVRVATPPILAGMTIVPRLTEFFDHFPGVTVEFLASERYADLVQEGLDLAIRIGDLKNSRMVARRIGSMQIATVTSPMYLARHGIPLKPSDLDTHHLLANRHLGAIGDWRFKNSERDTVTPMSGRFSCNNPADMHAAVLAGLGIAQSARALFEPQLRSGHVVEVLADFVPDPVPIHVLYGGTRVPHRVRVVSDFIAQCVSEEASLRL